MKSTELYKKETNLEAYNNSIPTNEYVKWLERKIEPSILTWIKNMFKHAKKKEWFAVYFVIDIHGTISKPDYRKTSKEIIYYPYAKETLQLLSDREDIVLILFTSSYPEEIERYNEIFKKDNIIFKYINENPEISDTKGSFGYYRNKLYFNALLDDKSGFSPKTDWKYLYDYFRTTKYRPNKEWLMKYKEEYHK